jgi:uncharacterized protein
VGDFASTLAATYLKDLATLTKLTPDEVNDRDEDGRTPLMHAVLAEDADPTVVRLLIERGTDVNAVDIQREWSALQFAARSQKAPIVRILLEAGAEVDRADADGNTPLFNSTMTAGRDLSVIRELVRHGADPRRQNRHGVSASSLARSVKREDIEAVFGDEPDHQQGG